MINNIIKLLGGFTRQEYSKLQSSIIEKDIIIDNVFKNSLDSGQIVYIKKDVNDDRFTIGTPYYLLESYNNRNWWYISTVKNDNQRRELTMGINYKCLTYEKPKICSHCNQIIK
jgi:outer membrane protein assembly factor BamE (lipoprotein component of BamABCDE complex)